MGGEGVDAGAIGSLAESPERSGEHFLGAASKDGAEIVDSAPSPPSPTVFHYIGEARKGQSPRLEQEEQQQQEGEREQQPLRQSPEDEVREEKEGPVVADLASALQEAAGASKEEEDCPKEPAEEEGGEEGAALPHFASAPACCSEEGASREVGARASVVPQTSYATSKADQYATSAAQSAAAAAAIASEMWDKLNAKLAEMPGVKAAAEYLNVSPLVVTSSAILCFLGFLLFGLGGQLVCTIVGALYPAFESFKVVESSDVKMMEFWLTYWVVFAMLSGVEHVGYYILAWLPFYYPLKLGFLFWLASPSTGGARYTYRWFVSPLLHRNRERIDTALEQSGTKLKTGIKSAAKGAIETSLGSAKGAGSLGLSKLKLGFQLVRPSVGNMASVAMEAAFSAARSRSFGNLSAAGEGQVEPAAEAAVAQGEDTASKKDVAEPLLAGQEDLPAAADSEPEPELEDASAVARSAEEEKGGALGAIAPEQVESTPVAAVS